VRHFRLRAMGAATAVALTVLAAACSSSPSTSSNSAGPSSSASASTTLSANQGLNPGTGAPKSGGTLNEVGVSDVKVMDYDLAYYSTDDQQMRLTERSLYNWGNTPSTATTPEPDLATAAPVATNGGKTVSVTIRSGVMWNSTPPRAVTAADVVRGIKRACNPSAENFGGMADFESTIVGLSAFCAAYPKASANDAAAMKKYIEGTNVSGITVKGDTITFQLAQASAWLEGAMTLAPFTATPIEAESALPGSPGVYNHLLSDGPYKVASYTPKKSITFVRNPVWSASTDPLRKAYVNQINVDETGDQTTIYQQISTNSPSLGLTWDSLPPPADDVSLGGQVKSGSQNVGLFSTYSSNPYVVYNTVSPNNSSALGKAAVRQALSYGLERSQLTKTLGGPDVVPPLTHILPPGIDGAQDVPASYDPYPYNQSKAKSMLAAAGFTPSNKLTVKFLYRSDSQGQVRLFENMQAQWNALGDVNVVGVATNQSDFYGKYLAVTTSPTPAQTGAWDIAIAGWSPDWYGNSAVSFFNPLYSSPGGFPANGGSNFGYFSDSTVNSLIKQALNQSSEAQADPIWAKADEAVMSAAAIFPITDDNEYGAHASYVHNAVYIPIMQQYDAANVWLSNG